jgi:putative transposase
MRRRRRRVIVTSHMPRRSFSEADIRTILRAGARARTIGEVCRRYGISDTTYYRWQRHYGLPAAGRARGGHAALAEENRRLKELVMTMEAKLQRLVSPSHGRSGT